MTSKLYLYWDLAQQVAWAPDAAAFRRQCGSIGGHAVRVAHVGVVPPAGYRATSSELACDPVERIPTVRDFVRSVTP